MKPLHFLGNGGHAGNLRDLCALLECEVIDSTNKPIFEGQDVVLAFGALNPADLEKRANKHISHPGAIWPSLVHPDAVVSPTALLLGAGHQVLARAFIGRNAQIGAFSIINTGAVVEHDAVIGVGCHIAPGALVLGGARVGDYSFVGANAVIVQKTVVHPRSFIRAGSVCNG